MVERTVIRLVGRAAVCLLCATSLLTCDDSPVGNNSDPGTLEVRFAPAISDTVDAQPNDAVVLSVTNGDGTPVVGTTVTVEATNAQVAAPGRSFSQTAGFTTDSRGEAAVFVRLGTVAGPASVHIEVPTLRVSQTLEFQVSPGATVGPGFTPAEVVALVGVPFQVEASAVDRHGNATGGPLPVAIESGPVEQTGSEFTGLSIGEATLSATLDGTTVSATVRLVPDGEVVYTSGASAWLVPFVGGEPELLSFSVPSVREPSVSWNASGTDIVLGGFNGFVVFDLVNEVVSPSAWPGEEAGSNVLWPRFGPDGRIYYSSADGGGAWDVRSANPDASSSEVLIPSGRFDRNDFFPDWAPDGSAFVFTADWEEHNRFVLRVSDPGTDDIATLGVEGTTPVWSPDGALIAYQELGVVGVVSPDGSVDTSWNPGWSKGVTWSPESNMLVGINNGQIAVIDITTGAMVTLPHLGDGIDAVAWRPEAN